MRVLSATELLLTGHAVARVLDTASDEAAAVPELLAALADGLAATPTWVPEASAATGLAARCWESGAAVLDDTAVAFPVRCGGRTLAVIELAAAAPGEPLPAALESIGAQIGQFVMRCRTELEMREIAARRVAILDVAFDCIVTMDHRGRVVDVNRAVEQTFGYTAEEMIGREVTELIVPAYAQDMHRHGVERQLTELVGRRVELTALRSDGSELPIELVVTRPDLPGPPMFYGYLRDVSERHATEAALRRLVDEQAALRRVATAVAAEGDPADLFGLVTEEVGRLLGAETAHLIRYDDEGEIATIVGGWAAHAGDTLPIGAAMRLDSDTGVTRVWKTGRPARIDSYGDAEGSLADTLRELGVRSVVVAPVSFGGRLWGAVVIATLTPHPFTVDAEQRLADFAELTAQALANAQAREDAAASRARIVLAGDAERRRLERNLHDGAQQRLVSLLLLLRLVTKQLGSDSPTAATLERGTQELVEALHELRELARGIHPAILTERGLEPAVEALVTRAPLPVELEVTLDGRLPAPVEAAAYYVVAEALTNVAKYAHASGVRVEVARRDGRARIEVADDGVGGADPAGSGLRGLADRVEALSGRFTVDSPADGGTTLRAEIPV